MTPQDVMERERYFTRHTQGLLWLEFVLVGAGFALLLFGQGASAWLALGMLLSSAGLLANIWRNVQRFWLMDEFEQLTLFKGLSAAFILLMTLVFMGGLALFFVVPAAGVQTVATVLLGTFVLAHLVLSAVQSRLIHTPGESK